ncbi:alpha-N-acetylgalactosamine-specific lectin-like isoform X2 [Corticium candelabrum]|uniref:alpha-N-acetylgalactosamine-specific lectin-like isoform X2 n=1 Tax=Corticium candelabrum TaxID=121492 RepID=UPI002E25EDAB|nr:alpha-N-acetylgalactosamine-specific lectin-like isoform X2 [Corticium candelabrum]
MDYAATLALFLLIVQGLPVSSMQCQTGWTRSGLSCYLLVRTSKELNDAETDCVSKGGHLASITSDNENSVVLSLRGTSTADANDTWIGLHDQVVENTFVWTDGTKSTYTNWDPAGNEPNDSGDCVRIRSDGKWRDHKCSFLYPYVCESNATLSTTQTPTTLSATTSAGATASLSTATASGTQWQTRDSTSRSRHTSVPTTTTDSTEYAKSSKTSSSATTFRSNVKPSKRMIHLTRYTHVITVILTSK